MTSIILTLIISLSFLFAEVARKNPRAEPKWRKIVLMRSTREDVERLLGKSQYSGFNASYTVEDGTLDVVYYPFNHCSEPGADLRVPQWTVVELTYEPDNPPRLEDLHLDSRKFRKQKESRDVPDLTSYINNETGVDYTFQADNTLSDIRYFPAKRYDYLRCNQTQSNRRKKPL